jgi:lipid-A-disaccharide synthase-like uncharacterized protein
MMAKIWLGVGLIGQSLFFMRFLFQWVASERQGRSVLPMAFWYFSFLGGSVLLVYAIHTWDPVFIVGQAAGLLIYTRNLMLTWKNASADLPDDKS